MDAYAQKHVQEAVLRGRLNIVHTTFVANKHMHEYMCYIQCKME